MIIFAKIKRKGNKPQQACPFQNCCRTGTACRWRADGFRKECVPLLQNEIFELEMKVQMYKAQAERLQLENDTLREKQGVIWVACK